MLSFKPSAVVPGLYSIARIYKSFVIRAETKAVNTDPSRGPFSPGYEFWMLTVSWSDKNKKYIPFTRNWFCGAMAYGELSDFAKIMNILLPYSDHIEYKKYDQIEMGSLAYRFSMAIEEEDVFIRIRTDPRAKRGNQIIEVSKVMNGNERLSRPVLDQLYSEKKILWTAGPVVYNRPSMRHAQFSPVGELEKYVPPPEIVPNE